MSEENFTFNFYGNVGQNIAKVEKMDVHMGEDGTIQVMNAEGITMPSNQQSHSDELNKTSEPTIEQRIKAVYDSNLCRIQADWGIVFRLLVELKKFGPTEYDDCADLINSVCGKDVTNTNAIRLSKANQNLSGSYHSGYRDTSPSVQTDSFLKRVNEIADIFMQK